MTHWIELICPECDCVVGFDWDDLLARDIDTVHCTECQEPIKFMMEPEPNN